MARWVCRLHNLYFAQRSALFVRLPLLYKDVFFRIDARSDLDSQGRFSRGKVILVGINLFRHWFRMDLSFNQFSLTGTVFWKWGPAAPNLLPDSFPISLFELTHWAGFYTMVRWVNIQFGHNSTVIPDSRYTMRRFYQTRFICDQEV